MLKDVWCMISQVHLLLVECRITERIVNELGFLGQIKMHFI